MKIHRVIGPPGTGKTTYLARQVDLAVKAGEDILVVALTKAAARAAAGKLRGLDDRVGTLHAFARRSLGADGNFIADTPANIQKWNEAHPWYRLSTRRLFADDDGDEELSVKSTRSTPADSLMLTYLVTRARMENLGALPVDVRDFVEAWERWKREEGLVDFTDMIEQCMKYVDAAPGDPTVIFVDERQDLSRLEVALVEKWAAAAGHLVEVGDPWQNLYEWRGTDGSIMGEPDHVLAQSHRIPGAIHALAMKYMVGMPGWSPLEYDARDDEGLVVRHWGTWKMPDSIIPMMEEDVDSGNTVMFVASCEYMLVPIIRRLRDRGLPFHNPYRPGYTPWNPLSAEVRLREKEKQPAAAVVEAFLAPQLQQGRIPLKALESWVSAVYQSAAITVRRRDLEGLPEVDGSVDMDMLVDVLTVEALDAVLGGDLEWLAENLLKSHGAVKFVIEVARQRGVEVLKEVPKIIVSTVHGCKGGEAQSVYFTPDVSSSSWREMYGGGGGEAAVYRMVYVAITRASEKLTILEPAGKRTVRL